MKKKQLIMRDRNGIVCCRIEFSKATAVKGFETNKAKLKRSEGGETINSKRKNSPRL